MQNKNKKLCRLIPLFFFTFFILSASGFACFFSSRGARAVSLIAVQRRAPMASMDQSDGFGGGRGRGRSGWRGGGGGGYRGGGGGGGGRGGFYQQQQGGQQQGGFFGGQQQHQQGGYQQQQGGGYRGRGSGYFGARGK